MPPEGNTAFNPDQFNAIYPPGVDRHYWNRARNAVIAEELHRTGARGSMLEVGCGKGLVVAYLRKHGINITGVELAQVDPVEEAKAHVQAGLDALSLAPEFRASVRTILLLDVIEHIEDPVAFLSMLRGGFKNVETLVATVPARQELFSNFDRFNHHFRRYAPALLRQHIDPAGIARWNARYFFHALYPAAWLRLKLTGNRTTRFGVPSSPASKVSHALLGHCFRLEAKWLPKHWPGTSIIASATFRTEDRV